MSVSLVFCHVLALVFPSYVFVFMMEIWARTLPKSLAHVSVTPGSYAVSVNLLPYSFSEIPAATSFK